MRQKLILFVIGLLVGLGLPFGAGAIPELFDHAGGDADASVRGNVVAAEIKLPSTKPQPSNAVVGGRNGLSPTRSLAEIIPAVVRVSSGLSAGSGVVIDPIGVVLTTAHLVGDNTRVQVLIENSKPLNGTVTRIDVVRDLALVELPYGDYRSAELGDAGDIRLGAPVTALGYPLNLGGPATVTTGVVSRFFDEPESSRKVIQTDAAINIGHSGGPLVDARGRVIGIIISVLGEYQSRPTSGISYAVSVTTIKDDFLPPILSE